MQTIKVIHIITKLELGGAQKNTLFTLKRLDRRRYRPYLISGRGGILDREARGLKGVEVHFVSCLVREIRPFLDAAAFVQLVRLLRRIIGRSDRDAARAAIVHTHSSKAGILGRFAARCAGIPFIIHTFHGFGFHDLQPAPIRCFFIALERLVSKVTTRFIAVSENNIKKGISLGIFRTDQVVLIRSGIDVKAFCGTSGEPAKAKEGLGLPPDVPVVTMIGCFKPQKAPVDFVRMASEVHRTVPDARFLLVGDGGLRAEIERARRSFGLEEVLLLTGWREDIPEILEASDLLILTSRWEGLPRVFPEAMASAVPIVATGVDGASEVIRDGENGFLVEPGDTRSMAERVTKLLMDPPRRREMGRRGLMRLREFDIFEMVRKQEALYEELLRAGSAGRGG